MARMGFQVWQAGFCVNVQMEYMETTKGGRRGWERHKVFFAIFEGKHIFLKRLLLTTTSKCEHKLLVIALLSFLRVSMLDICP